MIINKLEKIRSCFKKKFDEKKYLDILGDTMLISPNVDLVIFPSDTLLKKYLKNQGFKDIVSAKDLGNLCSLSLKTTRDRTKPLKLCACADLFTRMDNNGKFIKEVLKEKLRVHEMTNTLDERQCEQVLFKMQAPSFMFGKDAIESTHEFSEIMPKTEISHQMYFLDIYKEVMNFTFVQEIRSKSNKIDVLEFAQLIARGATHFFTQGKWLMFSGKRFKLYAKKSEELMEINSTVQCDCLLEIIDYHFLFENNLFGLLDFLLSSNVFVNKETVFYFTRRLISQIYQEYFYDYVCDFYNKFHNNIKRKSAVNIAAFKEEQVEFANWLAKSGTGKIDKREFSFVSPLSKDKSNTIDVILDVIIALIEGESNTAVSTDLYWVAKLEEFCQLVFNSNLKRFEIYDDFKIPDPWRSHNKSILEIFRRTDWPIFELTKMKSYITPLFKNTLEEKVAKDEKLKIAADFLGLLDKNNKLSTADSYNSYYTNRFRYLIRKSKDELAKEAFISKKSIKQVVNIYEKKEIINKLGLIEYSETTELEREFQNFELVASENLCNLYPNGLHIPHIKDIFPAVIKCLGVNLANRNIPFSKESGELADSIGPISKGIIIFIMDALGSTVLNRLILETESLNYSLAQDIRDFYSKADVFEHSCTVFPSDTVPAHVTFIAGAPPSEHGVYDNEIKNNECVKKRRLIGKSSELNKFASIYDAFPRAFFLDKIPSNISFKLLAPYELYRNDEGDYVGLTSFLLAPLIQNGHVDANDIFIKFSEEGAFDRAFEVVKVCLKGENKFLILVQMAETDSLLEKVTMAGVPEKILWNYLASQAKSFSDFVQKVLNESKGILIMQTADHGISKMLPVEKRPNFQEGRTKEVNQCLSVQDREIVIKELNKKNIVEPYLSKIKSLSKRKIYLKKLNEKKLESWGLKVGFAPRSRILLAPHISQRTSTLWKHGGFSVEEMIIPIICWRNNND